MTKLQLSLTNQEAFILGNYGSQFGYNLTRTVKYLISKASEKILEEESIPTFKMSEKTEKAGLKALEEYRLGKTREMSDVDGFFDSL